ncbi:hypothetical protein niasHT_008989 [Heterodera trifolii]|uniref:Uncharacterized protein n=1 Tax=Heterodera trifolii TaxID=157864 RepID=A0ABD2LW58_9BILA
MANGKPMDKIPAQGMPSRFNYANQLKIMLENRKKYELMHTKIGLTIHGKCQTKVPDNVFQIFALRNALKTEEQFKECQQNETEHIFRIVFALRAGIISTNRCVVTTLSPELSGEQLRFIGLVFGELLFRENPIFDETKKEFHFSANIEPEIDALNQTECQLLSNQFDRQLNTQLTQLIGQALDNPEESESSKNFCAFFEFLERRILNDQMEPGDKEKWAELEQKSLLIAKYGPEFPLIAPIMRVFIIFGTDAPKLIVLYRALLGGFIDEAQLDAFLREFCDSKTLKLETKSHRRNPSIDLGWNGRGMMTDGVRIHINIAISASSIQRICLQQQALILQNK